MDNHYHQDREVPKIVYIFLLLTVLACISLLQLSQMRPLPPASPKPSPFRLLTAPAPYRPPFDRLHPLDYPHLINLTNFTFRTLPAPCGAPLLLLVLVHSSVDHFRQRATIRRTWGAANSTAFRLVFVLGAPGGAAAARRVRSEARRHRDLAQGSFRDTYRNLTYKHMTAYKYALYHCAHAKYVLKCDDDTFVNTPQMLNFLANDLSPFGARNLLFCPVFYHTPVLRSWRDKWRVTAQEVPDQFYPDYCGGFIILYSPDVVFRLYQKAQLSPYFWIDDVYLTGIIAKKVGIEAVNIKRLQGVKGAELGAVFLFGRYNMAEREMEELWGKLRGLEVPKSVFGWGEKNWIKGF